ncbi:MAG: nucleoside monophosphate kinase [Synechococcales bacterium]|nr:nucleoside monophosphate kinase [Synechococcales bacterium]
MRLMILGGPGSGRTTQALQLAAALEVKVISTGELLRDAIALETELGQQVKSLVEKGEFVPDEFMIEFIKLRLRRSDVSNGWILEGYPRTAFQAEELDFLLEERQQVIDFAISLEIEAEVLMERSLSRARPDDTPEAIQRRIDLHQDLTLPMLEYYELRGKLLRIDGNQPIPQVTQQILQGLEQSSSDLG